MKNWIPKKKFFTLVLCGTLFSALVYLAGFFLVLSEINTIEDSYTNTKSESARYDKAQSLRAAINTSEPYLQNLRSFFIKKEDEVKFIEKIEEVGKNSGIEFAINSIDPKPNKEDVPHENLIIKMNVEGKWEDIMLFVYSIERMQFGVSILSMNLDSDKSGTWSGFVEFEVYREK